MLEHTNSIQPSAEMPPCLGLSSFDDADTGFGDMFAAEPELILAMLESHEATSDDQLRKILAGATEAIRQKPRYADVYYCAGRVAFVLAEYDLADDWLETAITLNPLYNDALILLAKVAKKRSVPNKGIELLNRALDNGADYPDVHLMLGELYEQLGRLNHADSAYSRSIELNPHLSASKRGLNRITSRALREKKR